MSEHERLIQGESELREAVEVPADGTLSEPIEGDGTGEALPPIDDED